MTGRIAAAIVTCIAMLMIALAPAVVGDTHLVVKGDQGPSANAKSWDFSPPGLGSCSWHVVNYGLRWLTVDVFDNTTGTPEQIMHQRIRFASYNAFPMGEVDTDKVIMSPTHDYLITVTPSGPKGSYCSVEDAYVLAQAPVPVFGLVVDHMTVYVDGSGAFDPDGTVVSWGWNFGDGAYATGMTATHTYAKPGTYAVTLSVMDNDGLMNGKTQNANIIDLPPVASFRYSTNGLTVNVEASDSSDDYGIAQYTWNWGDGTTGTGITATHTYGAMMSPTATQTASDSRGPWMPFTVVGFTYGSDGVTPIPGAMVTVTNKRTLDSSATLSEDAGYYSVDLNNIYEFPHGFLNGDLINVTASHYSMSGGSEGVVDTFVPYLWIDVTMSLGGGIWLFPITLTVTDTVGQTGKTTSEVAIAPQPIASFICSVDGSTVSVDASGSSAVAGIASYEWNWGDGTTGSGMTAEHTYSQSVQTPTMSQSTDGRVPGFPYTVFGYVYLPGDSIPCIGATVVVINLRSGFTATLTTDEYGFYIVDLDPGTGGPPDSGGPWQGDRVNVTATKDTMIGWNEGTVDFYVVPYLWLDVNLSYGQGGAFTVTLTVTDTLGQTDTISMLVTVS